MKIEIEVTEIEYEALKLRSAQNLLRTDQEGIMITARTCLLEFLCMEDRINKDRVVEAILKPSLDPEKPQQKTNGFVEAAHARQASRIEKRKEVTVPDREWQGKTTAAWRVFCFLAKEQLNQKTWSSFTARDTNIGTGLEQKSAYDGIQRLARLGCVYESGTRPNPEGGRGPEIKQYSITEAGKKWLLDRGNQAWMIEQYIIDPPKEPDQA